MNNLYSASIGVPEGRDKRYRAWAISIILRKLIFELIPISNISLLNRDTNTIDRILFSLLLPLAQDGFIFVMIPLFNQKRYFLFGRKKSKLNSSHPEKTFSG